MTTAQRGLSAASDEVGDTRTTMTMAVTTKMENMGRSRTMLLVKVKVKQNRGKGVPMHMKKCPNLEGRGMRSRRGFSCPSLV